MTKQRLISIFVSLVLYGLVAIAVNAYVRGNKENALPGDAVAVAQMISEARTDGGDPRADCNPNFGLQPSTEYPLDFDDAELQCSNSPAEHLLVDEGCRQIAHYATVQGQLFALRSSHVFAFDGNLAILAAVETAVRRYQTSPSEAVARWGDGITLNRLLSSPNTNVSTKQCGKISIIRFMER